MRNAVILSISLLTTTSACMLGPVDDKTVANKESSVAFSGFHLNPGSRAYIQAKNFDTGLFETIGAPSASRSSLYTLGQTPLYPWSSSLVLADQYWQDGFRGARAQVRTLWSTSRDNGGPLTIDGGAMMSVERDWYSCFRANQTPPEFRDNCAADSSPIADIKTRSYCASRPQLYVRDSRVDYESWTAKIKFSVWVGTNQNIDSIYADDQTISCRPQPQRGKFLCETSASRGPFTACELHDWLQRDGRIVVQGRAGSGACVASAQTITRVPARRICGHGSRPAPVPNGIQVDEECDSGVIASGWIKTDDFWDPTRCGEPTAISYNVRKIARLDTAPRGTVLEVCNSEPLPRGWTEVRTYLSTTRCGHPSASSRRDNIRVIARE